MNLAEACKKSRFGLGWCINAQGQKIVASEKRRGWVFYNGKSRSICEGFTVNILTQRRNRCTEADGGYDWEPYEVKK